MHVLPASFAQVRGGLSLAFSFALSAKYMYHFAEASPA